MKNFEDMGILEMCKTLGEMGDDLNKQSITAYGMCHACYDEPQFHQINTCDCYCHTRDK